MNKLPIYLYSNIFEVIIDLDETKGIHKVMYQRKLKLQKGFKDSIQIQFKNSDQKPMSISSSTYWFDMIDSSGRQLVLSKPLVNLETISTGTSTTILNKGLALAEFDYWDTVNLTAASYKFLVKKENNDGTFTPAYSNTYYGITGEVEIVEDGFPIGYPIQTVDIKKLESGKDYDRTVGSMGYVFVSEWLRPVERATTTVTTCTAAISLSRFVGEVRVEATLDPMPSGAGHANAQVFTVTNHISVTPTDGIINLSWDVPYAAVRFKVKPANDSFGVNYYPTGNPIGSNTNKYPNGFVDQIQFFC